MQVVHIEYGKMIRTSQKGFVYTILVELFTAHLLKEKPRFYHFVKPRYMRHKECRNIFVTPGNQTMATHQGSKRAARPGPTRLFCRAGRADRHNRWAGRAKLFVGPARPDVFILFFTFYQTLCLSQETEVIKNVL